MNAISDLARGGGASFIVGRVMNIVTRSAYGQRLASNQTRDIQNARNLATHTSASIGGSPCLILRAEEYPA